MKLDVRSFEVKFNGLNSKHKRNSDLKVIHVQVHAFIEEERSKVNQY